jgi:hypothetical protein
MQHLGTRCVEYIITYVGVPLPLNKQWNMISQCYFTGICDVDVDHYKCNVFEYNSSWRFGILPEIHYALANQFNRTDVMKYIHNNFLNPVFTLIDRSILDDDSRYFVGLLAHHIWFDYTRVFNACCRRGSTNCVVAMLMYRDRIDPLNHWNLPLSIALHGGHGKITSMLLSVPGIDIFQRGCECITIALDHLDLSLFRIMLTMADDCGRLNEMFIGVCRFISSRKDPSYLDIRHMFIHILLEYKDLNVSMKNNTCLHLILSACPNLFNHGFHEWFGHSRFHMDNHDAVRSIHMIDQHMNSDDIHISIIMKSLDYCTHDEINAIPVDDLKQEYVKKAINKRKTYNWYELLIDNCACFYNNRYSVL